MQRDCMKKSIAFVVSTPSTAEAFLSGHIAALMKYYNVDLIADFPMDYKQSLPTRSIIRAPIRRNVNLWFDIVALLSLFKIFRDKKYDAVHSVSPKAGLLAMLAAKFARVRIRNHTNTGQVWVTRKGFSRWMLRSIDKLVNRLATHSLVDSASQRFFLLEEGVLCENKSSVLANG